MKRLQKGYITVRANPPSDHGITSLPKLTARDKAIARINKRKMKASFFVNSPYARGLPFVLSTCLSISESARSLITQPADLMTKTPTIKTTKILVFGNPFEASQRADRVGQSSKSIPIGLSNRANLEKLMILFILNYISLS